MQPNYSDLKKLPPSIKPYENFNFLQKKKKNHHNQIDNNFTLKPSESKENGAPKSIEKYSSTEPHSSTVSIHCENHQIPLLNRTLLSKTNSFVFTPCLFHSTVFLQPVEQVRFLLSTTPNSPKS